MAFPNNRVEELLSAAAEGRTGIDEFLTVFVESEVWVPVSGDLVPDSAKSLVTVTVDSRPYVVVFTSEQQLRLVYPNDSGVVPPLKEFVATLPKHVGIAVNPGGDLGLPISAESIEQALGGVTSLAAGTTVKLGEPSEEPTALLAEIRESFNRLPVVKEARRCWAQVGSGRPGLVIGVDVDPDNATARRTVIDAVGMVVGHSPADFPVDVVFSNDRDTFTTWMTQNTAAFYGS